MLMDFCSCCFTLLLPSPWIKNKQGFETKFTKVKKHLYNLQLQRMEED